jgi:hypothetical protein
MYDPMYPRVPSLRSMITFGVNDPNAPPTIPTEEEQFLHAMSRRGVTAIQDDKSEENNYETH